MDRSEATASIRDQNRSELIELGMGKAGSGAGQLLTYARALSRMSLIDWAPARRNRIGGRADPKRSEEEEIKIDQGKPLWRGARKDFYSIDAHFWPCLGLIETGLGSTIPRSFRFNRPNRKRNTRSDAAPFYRSPRLAAARCRRT
jgi:hypothetical protein